MFEFDLANELFRYMFCEKIIWDVNTGCHFDELKFCKVEQTRIDIQKFQWKSQLCYQYPLLIKNSGSLLFLYMNNHGYLEYHITLMNQKIKNWENYSKYTFLSRCQVISKDLQLYVMDVLSRLVNALSWLWITTWLETKMLIASAAVEAYRPLLR